MTEPDANELRFSADVGRNMSAGPPGGGSVVGVRDVIICAKGEEQIADGEWRAHPPVGALDWAHGHWPDPDPRVSAIDLGRYTRIMRLPSDEAAMVQTACQPRGHYFFPIGAPNQVYSFVRTLPASEYEANPYGWDSDGVLNDALIFSRLIRDNGYSKQYAARINDYEGGEQQVVFLAWTEDAAIWRLHRTREYLDGPEAEELATLLAAYWEIGDAMPERVSRAIWRVAYAPRLRWADLVLSFVVSGLEALLTVEETNFTRNFKRQTAALAAELGVDGVDRDFCGRMYKARSDWVHGAHVSLIAPAGPGATEDPGGPEGPEQLEKLAEVALLQDLLRKAVRRCVEDAEFRAVFADDEPV